MRQAMLHTAGAIVFFIFLMTSSACSQTLNIWPGAAPGSENWSRKEKIVDNTPLGTVIFNVVTPTLTVYLPEKTKATGTAVIIAPGGAFVALAIDLEGNNVARWLQSKGIAAFVLKYRIMEKRQEGIPADLNMDEAGKYGIADGIQAIKVVRQHARGMGHFARQRRLYGLLGRRYGGQRSSAPAGCRRTSKLRCTNLWCPIWRHATYSGKTAAHFFGVGAG